MFAYHKDWYTNGQPYVFYFKNYGELDGPYRKWYEDGQLNIKCEYKDGELDGSYKKWYENGHLKIECEYKNGKIDGHTKNGIQRMVDNFLENMYTTRERNKKQYICFKLKQINQTLILSQTKSYTNNDK